MAIWNLTQHKLTRDQLDAGVQETGDKPASLIRMALTVNDLPTTDQVDERVQDIISVIGKYTEIGQGDQVMIGCAPWMVTRLQLACIKAGYEPVFAFSKRKSVDQIQADGSVLKVVTFIHQGFVKA